MPAIHPVFRSALSDKSIQNLVVLSVAAGVISSVSGYWAFNEAKGEARMDTTKAIAKATIGGVVVLLATTAYESWLIEKARRA
jgi:hypothetical protein